MIENSMQQNSKGKIHSHSRLKAIRGVAFGTLVGLQMSACSFIARDSEAYRTDTRNLVSARSPDIKACYDGELAKNPALTGAVVVNFRVEKKSGQVLDPVIDSNHSTAPASLGQCIVQAINGLTLPEPDRRDGEATFTWDFQAQPGMAGSAGSAETAEEDSTAVSANTGESVASSGGSAGSGGSGSSVGSAESLDSVNQVEKGGAAEQAAVPVESAAVPN